MLEHQRVQAVLRVEHLPHRRSAGITPTPQMPQSCAPPWFISRSWYIAWCARWNPPTPKWTTPGVTSLRS